MQPHDDGRGAGRAPWYRRPKIIGPILAVVAVIVIAGVAGGGGKKHDSTDHTSTTAVDTATTARPARAGSSSSSQITTATTTACALTGLGATPACWNSRHQPDPNPKLDAGCCYSPQITSGPNANRDRYVAVSTDPVVSLWIMLFDEDTPRAVADQLVKADLPPDSQVTGTGTLNGAGGGTCQYVNYRSAMAAAALATPKIGDRDGTFSVIYSTYRANGDLATYDPGNVIQANVSTVTIKANITC